MGGVGATMVGARKIFESVELIWCIFKPYFLEHPTPILSPTLRRTRAGPPPPL